MESRPNLINVHRSFSETDMGRTLAGQVRYERYKPQEVSNRRWEELLGADVNNLNHLPLTRGLTRVMISRLRDIQPGTLSNHEEQVLETAALIHDWAEAVVGDVTYSDKTKDDEAEEKSQLTMILSRFINGSAHEAGELIDEAASGVVFNPESKLGDMFNTVERIGYMRTAIRASQHVISGDAPDCESGLRWIVADVFGNHISELIERSQVYAPVDEYLKNQSGAITQAYEVVGPDTFLNYSPEQQQSKEAAFNSSKQVWEMYR